MSLTGDLEKMAELLVEIDKAAESATWEKMALSDSVLAGDSTARAFTGSAGEWRFSIVSFSIENQGFPPGSRGYDGAGVNGSILVHLTRALAEKFFKAADGPDEPTG